MRFIKTGRTLVLFFIIGLALGITACGAYNEANNFKAPLPGNNVQVQWERIESPPNYPNSVHACFKGDGIYQTQDQYSSIQVIPNDPACK